MVEHYKAENRKIHGEKFMALAHQKPKKGRRVVLDLGEGKSPTGPEEGNIGPAIEKIAKSDKAVLINSGLDSKMAVSFDELHKKTGSFSEPEIVQPKLDDGAKRTDVAYLVFKDGRGFGSIVPSGKSFEIRYTVAESSGILDGTFLTLQNGAIMCTADGSVMSFGGEKMESGIDDTGLDFSKGAPDVRRGKNALGNVVGIISNASGTVNVEINPDGSPKITDMGKRASNR